MDIFGIGALEILFILIIALLVLGPHELVKTGKTIGRFLRKLVMSESWQTIQQASREMRNLPNRLMREAGIEDMEKEFKDLDLKELDELKIEDPTKEIGKSIKDEMKEINKGMSAWTTTPVVKETTGTSEPEAKPAPDPETQEGGEPSEVDTEENRIAPPDHETNNEAVTEQNHNNEKGDQ